MRRLPSQTAAAVETAIWYFNRYGNLRLNEPCDCGAQVRHNNGGNYHAIVRLAKDGGQVFMRREDSTCELLAPAKWEPIGEDEALNYIREHADWL